MVAMKTGAVVLLVILASACGGEEPAPPTEAAPPASDGYAEVKAYMAEELDALRAFMEVERGEPSDEELAAAMTSLAEDLARLRERGRKMVREYPELNEDPPPAALVDLVDEAHAVGKEFGESVNRAMDVAAESPEGSELRAALDRLEKVVRAGNR